MNVSDLQELSKILVCPACRCSLMEAAKGLKCAGCNSLFEANEDGYLEFRLGGEGAGIYEQDTTPDDYAQTQEYTGLRVFDDYLKPLLAREPFETVLDAGCGMGVGISKLLEEGYKAYGIDLPNLAKYWARVGNDPKHFLCCDAAGLPFPGGFFDVVYSFGVIEHIGTEIGYFTLSEDYWEARQRFANELIRVTKPGGRILVACPNKRFPIDIQHAPTDARSPRTFSSRIRSSIYDRTGVNLHPAWGRYHLLSYSETRKLFCEEGGARYLEPLPLKNYFGFSKFEQKFLKPFLSLAKLYVENLPRLLRTNFLNPYMLVQIRK